MIDEEDGQLFMAMEYVEGYTLQDKIKQSISKTEEVINIAIQIARGLSEAHEKGITIKHGSIGHVYAVSGDEEKARKILEELLRSEDPEFKQLFDDPRWNQLLKQMKLIKDT